jgi:hypothetical protein
MTIQPGDPLFTPGPRLGFVFRDRRELVVPFPEPEPDPEVIKARLASQAAEADRALGRAWTWTGKPSIGLAILLVVAAGAARLLDHSYHVTALAVAFCLACLPGLAFTCWCWLRRGRRRAAAPGLEYERLLAEWDQRAAGHVAGETARLASQPEWGSEIVRAPRTDVFGGTLAGWQGLLTVHGASLLAQRPVLVADLSGQHAGRLLMLAARQARIPATGFRLPHDLGRSGLLSELSPGQLATAIAEAVHSCAPGGSGAAAVRSDRSLDVRVLQLLAEALAARGVTPQRLSAAVQAALGQAARAQDDRGAALSPEEAGLIAGDLFPTAYREQVMPSLTRLDAVLAGLAAYPDGGWPGRPARLTCLVMDPAARSASSEVITSLLVQWLTVQVSAGPLERPVPAVIIAGADEVSRAHAERLSDVCEARGVPLTLMFRHLRDDATSLLGGGTAAFMRLGNHAEAEQAASYIGRRHTFVMSSFTATKGGSRTTTQGTSDSYGTGINASTARTSGWSANPAGGPFSASARSAGRTGTTGTSTSRTWGASWSQADGTSWSGARASQRVYEYAVEPTTLQGLPDYALLVADRSGPDLRLRAVECDPEIAGLPGVGSGPLPPPSAIRRRSVEHADVVPEHPVPDDAMLDRGGQPALDQPPSLASPGQRAGGRFLAVPPRWERSHPPSRR